MGTETAPAPVQILALVALIGLMLYHTVPPWLQARRQLREVTMTADERAQSQLKRFTRLVLWICWVTPIIYRPGALASRWGEHLLNGIYEGSYLPASLWVFIGAASLVPMFLMWTWTGVWRRPFERFLIRVAGLKDVQVTIRPGREHPRA